MQFLIVLAVLTVSSTALCRNVQLPRGVAGKVHLLHRLIMAGEQTELVRLLSQLQRHVNDGDHEGHTPLHWAVYADDLDSAKSLLKYKADPNIADKYGRTALHEAARVGSNEMLNLLIDSGGDPEAPDEQYGWDALFWAAYSGTKESLQTLIERVGSQHEKTGEKTGGADIYAVVLQQDDPSKMSGEDNDKIAKVELLLAAGVVPDIGVAMMLVPLEKMTSLAAVFNAHAGEVEFNTSNINGIDPRNWKTLLMKAMAAGSVPAAEFLLRQGADPHAVDGKGRHVLISDYQKGAQLEIAKLLLEHGVEVQNAGVEAAFYAALRHDDVELAELLLAKVTEDGENPVPDAWVIFRGVPNVGLAPAIQLAKSEEMQELLLLYGLGEQDRLNAIVRTLEQRVKQKQGGSVTRETARSVPDFLIDFNALAAAGKFKPVIGREREIQQVITALARKEKNNPLLVGEAGVGKTAIVEGLTQRIVAGDVPPIMRDKTVYALDMGLLLADNMHRGQLEAVITEELLPFIAENESNAILFVDEIHQLISSAAARGIADLLKPALARGDIHCIGATTQDDYQQHIMLDSALERRFFPVTVAEPSVADTIAIVSGLKRVYEQHHGITISDSAVQGAVKLADQYITNRYHPDKAIDLIDMAAAKVVVNEGKDLQFLQVAEVVADVTGVAVERILIRPQDKVDRLLPFMQRRIFGQDEGLEEIARYLSPFLMGVGDQDRPASLLLLGPTGVGKTETAKVLAEHFFGADDNLININLSEYRERHDVASLIGAPSGYIGYEQGGILTEAVRRKPFSVVLFDEIGEAHPDFAGILLKILDEGELTDKRGRTTNFRNTIIVITGNTETSKSRGSVGFKAGTEQASPSGVSASQVPIQAKLQGRLGKIITYASLPAEVMGRLISKELARFNAQLAQKNISISLTATLRKHLRERGYKPELGARSLQNMLVELVESPLSAKLATGELQENRHYRIGIRNGKITIKEQPATRQK